VALEPNETLHFYISTTSNVVSTTIIIEWGGGGLGYELQNPVPGLLHQRSAEQLKDSVFLHHEVGLHPANHIPQAFPLFSGTLD
jgi:hypothetical protein